MKKGTVLLTGVTGFLGSHITVQLLERGYQVLGTLRNKDRIPKIKAVIAQYTSRIDALSFAQADLSDAEVWTQVMQGVDYVMHVASPLPTTLPKDENTVIQPAKNGTLHILKAAKAQGVKRVVITSSIAAVVYGKRRKGHFSEADWSDETNSKDHTSYTKSKTIAERAAWEYVRNEGKGLELAVINPGLILGPVLEKDYGASAETVKRLLDGSLPAVPKFGLPIVDVRSTANLHLLALEKPEAAGERFICGGETYTMLQMAHVLREAYPKAKIPRRTLPDFLIRFVSNFDRAMKSILIELGADRHVSSEKAQKLLGWQPIPEQQAILDTAESLYQVGILKQK